MKYNGIEIEEYNDQYLTKQLGMIKGTMKLICVALAVLGVFVFLPTFIHFVKSYGFSVGLKKALPSFSYFVPICLLVGIPNLLLNRYKKVIQEELDKRAQKTGDNSYIDETKKASRRFLIILVVGIVIGSILFTSTLLGLLGTEHKSNGSNTCKSCGRTYEAGDIGKNFLNITNTGMCKKCENNYHAVEKFLDDNSK